MSMVYLDETPDLFQPNLFFVHVTSDCQACRLADVVPKEYAALLQSELCGSRTLATGRSISEEH